MLTLDPNCAVMGITMLVILFAAFTAMTRHGAPQALAMPIVACIFLGLQGDAAEDIVRRGFSHFADIAVLFTAVAVPAHQIERSRGFQWFASILGRRFGVLHLRWPRAAIPIMLTSVLVITFVCAALFHNITSILVVTPIAIRLCHSYGVYSRFLLCGMLVASNLGGFSTKWGDTPNIIESRVWGLDNVAFLTEVLPVNLGVLTVLAVVVIVLTRRSMHDQVNVRADERTARTAVAAAAYGQARHEVAVDRRLLVVGLGVLGAFITLQAVFPHRQIAIGAMAIVAATLLDRADHRLSTLKSLGHDVYLVFASIFILAGCVEHSWIGNSLQNLIGSTGGAPWSIAVTGYLGTTFTEAASWASAAATRIHPLNGSHTAAWALGAGICAGSSSIVTAASAGIVLCEESARFGDPAHVVTFRRYVGFGLSFSLLMLLIYIVYFTLAAF